MLKHCAALHKLQFSFVEIFSDRLDSPYYIGYIAMTDDRYSRVLCAQHVRQLEALRKTLPTERQPSFWQAVDTFSDVTAVFNRITIISWGAYFPPPDVNVDAIFTRVFLVMSGIVPFNDPAPQCPRCGGPTQFTEKASTPFGWHYRCHQAASRMSRAETRKRKSGGTFRCTGSVSAANNTWVEGAKNLHTAVSLLFCWLNRFRVTAAAQATNTGNTTAVDHYSMCREICEVIMSNEILQRQFGGPGIEVEVDETFLTRRKYHKGRHLRSETVTLLGIYERATKLGFHVQVRDKTSAVLLSEIQRFIKPGTSFIIWTHLSPTGEHTCFAGTSTVNRSPHRHSSRC